MNTKFFASFVIAIVLALCATNFAIAQNDYQPCYEEDQESTELYQREMPLEAAVANTEPGDIAIENADYQITIADVRFVNDSRTETAKFTDYQSTKLNIGFTTDIAYSPPNLNYNSFDSNTIDQPDNKLLNRQFARANERHLVQRE